MMSCSQQLSAAAPMITIEQNNTQAWLMIDSTRVAQIARLVLSHEAIRFASISITVTDDASIQVINARYLGHDWPTDVISFPYSDPGELPMVGELVLSAQMASETARQAGIDPLGEFSLYLVHGLLHLCGYDDRTAADVAIIRTRESEILALLGIDNPFDRVGSLAVMSDDSGRESVRWPR